MSATPPAQATRRSSDHRSSLDSTNGADMAQPIQQNGQPSTNGKSDDSESDDPVYKLQRELERTREEKDNLAAQYRTLLAKLTQMRTTLGNKLKEDAEELDRREQLVQQLNAQNEDLTSTVETLKNELIASHKEVERASHELDGIRTRVLQDNAQETLIRERELRETQMELERCKMECDEWERTALQEKAIGEENKSNLELMRRELELASEERERAVGELESERVKSSNLQSVLQDFQAAKAHELRQAVKDHESQLVQLTQSLAEYKHRALTAEMQLEESRTNITRTQDLEKEVKEKNLLIGKLRHEAIIMNEHLMEALRRLRRNSSDTNVDRRLVTNIILQFITTPRADAKRFEMLSLLASILSWTDQEREKAGLQRATSNYTSFWGRPSNVSSSKGVELEKSDETESFSRLWVEFLLTEAAAGENPAQIPTTPRGKSSLPGSPTLGSFPKSPSLGTRRLTSLGNHGMASSPNLTLPPVPSLKKDRQKEKPVELS